MTRDYLTTDILESLLTPTIVQTLTTIHEYRGIARLQQADHPNSIDALQRVAKIQSVESSNRIEGICTSIPRLNELMLDKTTPHNRNEQELMGYRDVLALIHEQHDFIPVTPGVILQLHRDLFARTGLAYGGRWKDSDNAIVELCEDGSRHTRFIPTPASETPRAIERLCQALQDARKQNAFDPLLTAAAFTFDFVSIHPFNDGNGRMSRLLLLLLLYQSGYTVGKYISIEKAIEKSKDSYYETLKASSTGWQDGTNDYLPFVEYLLGVIAGVYRDFDGRLSAITHAEGGKSGRVKAQVKGMLGSFSKHELQNALPDVSVITIERTLKQLLDAGTIEKIGAGRGTRYVLRR